jgi:hypothetical protein
MPRSYQAFVLICYTVNTNGTESGCLAGAPDSGSRSYMSELASARKRGETLHTNEQESTYIAQIWSSMGYRGMYLVHLGHFWESQGMNIQKSWDVSAAGCTTPCWLMVICLVGSFPVFKENRSKSRLWRRPCDGAEELRDFSDSDEERNKVRIHH